MTTLRTSPVVRKVSFFARRLNTQVWIDFNDYINGISWHFNFCLLWCHYTRIWTINKYACHVTLVTFVNYWIWLKFGIFELEIVEFTVALFNHPSAPLRRCFISLLSYSAMRLRECIECFMRRTAILKNNSTAEKRREEVAFALASIAHYCFVEIKSNCGYVSVNYIK